MVAPPPPFESTARVCKTCWWVGEMQLVVARVCKTCWWVGEMQLVVGQERRRTVPGSRAWAVGSLGRPGGWVGLTIFLI